jgi:hypothetical protein
MNVDFEKANFTEGYAIFSRKNLRRTSILKGEDGTFAVITQILDPITLETTTLRSFWLEDSLRIVISLYFTHYCKEDSIRI